MAKARLQVYEQEVGSDEEISELLHDSEPWQKKSASKQRVSPVHHMAPLHYATNANLLWQCKVPQITVKLQTISQQDDSTAALAEATAELFLKGDPIGYKDWKMSL